MSALSTRDNIYGADSVGQQIATLTSLLVMSPRPEVEPISTDAVVSQRGGAHFAALKGDHRATNCTKCQPNGQLER